VPADPVALEVPRRVHVVGIGGAGMSGLARLLVSLGHTVTGSDLVDSPTAVALRALGVPVAVGHDAANVGDVDLVTASPAVPADNPELVVAGVRGLRVATRAEVLGALCALRETLAIAGTHGKTTASSMLTLVLATAGRSPSWLVGADVTGLGANAGLGEGPELVMEADESYGTFAALAPALCALGNVEPDHLDHYGTLDALREAFAALLARSALCVVNADDPVAATLGRDVGAVRVGTGDADLVVADVRLERAASSFTLRHDGGTLEVRVGAPGPHNVQNAALAAAVALVRGVPGDAVVEALGRFRGAPRRFEFRGELRGATLVDDYAHLPGEVAAALATAKAGGWRRIVCVFQPHRYTRTQQVGAAFAHAFDGADVVVVTDVYGAGERPLPGVTGRLVADAVAEGGRIPEDGHPPEVRYVPERADVAAVVASLLDAGDLVLTMGAGDLTTLPDELRAVVA
jgi:UDP-N-acetylmuramate--alanine ligase